MSKNSNEDSAVSATAEDAIRTKKAAVDAGYYSDSYLEPFVKHSPGGLSTRQHHHPIIKRGTHARVSCINRAISAFLDSRTELRQVVLLGSGKDTAYFRYRDKQNGAAWYEVDQASVVRDKIKTIQSYPLLLGSEGTIHKIQGGFKLSNTSTSCHFLEHDLRQPNLVKGLLGQDIQPQAPTLFVLECVLMYLPQDSTLSLLQEISQQFSDACVVCYDPILGNDPFGRVMEQNLKQAGVVSSSTVSLLQTRFLDDHLRKMNDCGFPIATACDMWSAYETVVATEERRRANQCEFLDEMEEWMLIMKHYCLVVAGNSSCAEYLCRVGQVGQKSSPMGFSLGKCQASKGQGTK